MPLPIPKTPQLSPSRTWPNLALAPASLVPGVSEPGSPLLGGILHGGASLLGLWITALGALAVASLIGYSPARLRQMLEEGGGEERHQHRAPGERTDDEYLIVSWLLVVSGIWLGAANMQRVLPPDAQTWGMALFGLGLLLLGGSLPFAIARVRPERTLLAMLPTLRGCWFVLRWPVVLPILHTTRLLLRVFGRATPPPSDAADVQKQVMAAVADTVTDASLPAVERTWIGNIVGLQDLQVSTVMTPRHDIVAFPESMPLQEAVRKALEHGFSRYPIYRERIDEVIGIFYAKDALRLALDTGRQTSIPLRSMLREPLFVPETTGAGQLLRRFQAGNQHMAIVIDEYGTTVGLVTVEDVLEQIVGDIGDEYDPPPSAARTDESIQIVEAGRVLEFPARTTVAEINQQLGTTLPEDGDWATIAGLVIARLNHIPAVDETITIDGVEFRVLQADERRIRRLRATLLAAEPAEGQG